MTTELIVDRVWPAITEAADNTKSPAYVAVAYFGAGASKLLPLNKGSRLVVDASERSIKSGQTSPAELLKLHRKGVKVYSVENLHAKVFVFGRTAFVGSANVSKNSKEVLFEAVIRTSDVAAVRSARHLVKTLCLQQYTPKLLTELIDHYHPPVVPPRGAGDDSGESGSNLQLPKVYLAQLEECEWSEEEQKIHDAGLRTAKKKLRQNKNKEVDSFRWSTSQRFDLGDVVIQVTEDEDGRVFVSPPGNVSHIEEGSIGRRRKCFVFVEIPSNKRQRQLKVLAKKLGHEAQYKLRRAGVVRDRMLAMSLLKLWQD